MDIKQKAFHALQVIVEVFSGRRCKKCIYFHDSFCNSPDNNDYVAPKQAACMACASPPKKQGSKEEQKADYSRYRKGAYLNGGYYYHFDYLRNACFACDNQCGQK